MFRTGSICASLIYNYFTASDEETSVSTDEDHNSKVKKLRVLNETLKKYGGVFGKISQLLNLNDENNEVFSDNNLYASQETTRKFKEIVEKDPEKFSHLDIDFTVLKGGSIGQIYKSINKDNNHPIVIKVQYEGLYDQVQSDIKLVKMVGRLFYSFIDLKEALEDIKTKMNEELCYELEIDNYNTMYELWNDSGIVRIPKVYTDLCNDKMIVMDYMTGVPFTDFTKTECQHKKNKVAENIIRFVFTNMFKHNIFYSDLHYGNFFINEDDSISVVDFGCVHRLSDILLENIKNIILTLRKEDESEFTGTLKTMGIITPNTSEESIKYAYKYFNVQLSPLIKDEEFHFSEDYIYKHIDHKEPELLKQWGLPGELVYFNKIPQGMYRLLWKLDAKVNFYRILNEILE